MDFINQTFFSEYTEKKIDTIPYVLGIILALTNGSRILKFINVIISLLKRFIIITKSVMNKFKSNNITNNVNDDAHKEYEEVMKQMREMRVHLTALFNSIHKDNIEWRMSESIRREKKREKRTNGIENESKHNLENVNICETSGLETEICL
ncbi:NSP4 [Rotavirus C]|uniref:NSP4 n=1 Tax=Rotavirus C TaxID=36427 RepID=A0A0M3TCF1_9REOV|nr:NSP4 [Rotavirus C]